MGWLRLFPAFAMILGLVSNVRLYAELMLLSFLITIALCVHFVSLIRPRAIGTYRLHPVGFMLVGFGPAAIVVYFFLFTDLSAPTRGGGTFADVLAGSPLFFAFVYDMIFPFVTSLLLTIGIIGVSALFSREPPSMSGDDP